MSGAAITARAHCWPAVRAGEVLSLINGRAFKPSEWCDAGLPIIRIQNLNNPAAPFNRYGGDLPPKFLVKDGDLLFAWSGTPGTSFGAHIWRGGEAWLNQHIFNVRFDESQFDKRFLRYAINQNLSEYIRLAHGGAGLAHITKGRFEDSRLPKPPLPEQHRIVAEIEKQLTRLEAGVAALERVQANLKRYRAAVLRAACEGRLVPTEAALARQQGRPYEPASALLRRILVERRRRWEEAKPAKLKASGRTPKDGRWKAKYVEPAEPNTSTLAKVPEGWCWATLGQLVYVLEGGNAATAVSTSSRRRVLTSSAVRQGFVDFNDTRFYPDATPEKMDPYVQPGDLLFTRLSGTLDYVGNCAVVPDHAPAELEFPDRLFRARTVSFVCNGYVQHCFGEKTLRAALEKAAKSTAGHQRISLSDLRTYLLPLPPLTEQHRIAAGVERLLSLADDLAENASANLERATRLRQAMLAAAFEGRS